jgi:hypothetical protein
MNADPDEHVGEVVDRIDVGYAAGLSEGEDYGGGSATAHARSVRKVLFR